MDPHRLAGSSDIAGFLGQGKDAHPEAKQGIILGQGRASSLLVLVDKQKDARPFLSRLGFPEVSLGLGDRTN